MRLGRWENKTLVDVDPMTKGGAGNYNSGREGEWSVCRSTREVKYLYGNWQADIYTYPHK